SNAVTRNPTRPGRRSVPRRFSISSVMPGRSAIRNSCLLSGGYANCLRDVRREAVDGLWWRIPCAHEPHAGRADEIVETPAFGAHRLDDAHGQVDEDAVRFDGSDQFDARQLFERSGEPAGH